MPLRSVIRTRRPEQKELVKSFVRDNTKRWVNTLWIYFYLHCDIRSSALTLANKNWSSFKWRIQDTNFCTDICFNVADILLKVDKVMVFSRLPITCPNYSFVSYYRTSHFLFFSLLSHWPWGESNLKILVKLVLFDRTYFTESECEKNLH